MKPRPRMQPGDFFGGLVTEIEWLGGRKIAHFESLFPISYTSDGTQVKQGQFLCVELVGGLQGLEPILKTNDLFSAKVSAVVETPNGPVPTFVIYHKPADPE